MKKEKKKEVELTKGFKCKCGRFEKFPTYIYAHWNDVLTFECPDCKRQYQVLTGIVEEL